jgi:hypothetical protein
MARDLHSIAGGKAMKTKASTWSAIAIVALGLALCAPAAWAQTEAPGAPGNQRGFVLALGLGGAQVYYGADAEYYFSTAEAAGLERIEICLDLGAGWALTQNLYALLCVDSFATRFSDSYGSYIQLNSYLYGGGLRLYPFHTGLVLGVDGGIAKMVAMSNIGLALTSPSGWGVAVSISYDFNPKPTGMSIVIGGRANYNIMQGGAVTAVSVFAQVVWK